MSNERMTFEEMAKKYPDEWLFIVDCEHIISHKSVKFLLVLYYPPAGEISQPRLTRQTVGAVS